MTAEFPEIFWLSMDAPRGVRQELRRQIEAGRWVYLPHLEAYAMAPQQDVPRQLRAPADG